MRMCSLLPSATEIIFALGLGDQLVGVSHTCDFPPEASALPILTRSLRGQTPDVGEVPVHGVSESGVASAPSFALDGALLRELKPDLILTQDICEVCAIDSNTVFEVANRTLGYSPEFLTIRATRIQDILADIAAIGRAAGARKEAEDCVAGLQSRITEVHVAAKAQPSRRVLGIEWADPLRSVGLWAAESIQLAGGEPGLSIPGERSRVIEWQEVADYSPEVILLMPCSYDLSRSHVELAHLAKHSCWKDLPAVRSGEVYVFDGRVPSRHGPRTIDVLEACAEILHPNQFGPRWHNILYQRVATHSETT